MSKWFKIEQYKKLYHFIGAHAARYLFFGTIAGLLLFATELTFAYVLQYFLVVMKIIPPNTIPFPKWLPNDNMYLFMGFMALILFARGFAQWLNNYMTSAAYEIQLEHQRYRLVEWALRSSSVSSGELITLYNHGVREVGQILTNLQSLSVFLSTSGLMWLFLLKLSVKMTIIATAVLGLIAILSRVTNQISVAVGKRLGLRMDDINTRLLNNIKNLLLVRIYGTQDEEKRILKHKLAEVTRDVLRYQRFVHVKIITPQILGFILICGLSVAATRREWISSTLMVTYFYLFLRFVQAFSEVVRLLAGMSFSLPVAVNFAKWWAEHSHDGVRNPVADIQDQSPVQPLEQPIGWNLHEINFAYSSDTAALFKQFSLQIAPGSSLVIMGESGSGKSTLLSILLGLTEPTSGKIEVGTAQNWKSLSTEKMRLLKSVGYVGSESFLIAGTIRDNLLYGLSSSPGDAEIETALKTAGCDFVFQLPSRLNHSITEQGQGLSAGQKQRLTFARALLRNPKVLILDEATANLDSDTENKFVATLSALKGKMTIIAVTHRKALLEIADQTLQLPVGL